MCDGCKGAYSHATCFVMGQPATPAEEDTRGIVGDYDPETTEVLHTDTVDLKDFGKKDASGGDAYDSDEEGGDGKGGIGRRRSGKAQGMGRKEEGKTTHSWRENY